MPRLLEAGVRTFKIEGRLKSPEYVYVSTLAYRRAIDEAWEAREAAAAAATDVLDAVALENRAAPPPLADDALPGVFARAGRGARRPHPRLLRRPAPPDLRPRFSPSHRGVCAGTVVSAPVANSVRVRLRAELSAGDGVAFGAAASEAGGALWAVHAHAGDEVTLELEDPRKLVGVRPGQLVWRTQHAALQRQLKTALADASAGRASSTSP